MTDTSKLTILINDSIPRSDWQKFLVTNSYSSPFQSPEFFDLFNSVKNLSAIAIAIMKEKSIQALTVITIQKEHGIKGFFSRRASKLPRLINLDFVSFSFSIPGIPHGSKRGPIRRAFPDDHPFYKDGSD